MKPQIIVESKTLNPKTPPKLLRHYSTIIRREVSRRMFLALEEAKRPLWVSVHFIQTTTPEGEIDLRAIAILCSEEPKTASLQKDFLKEIFTEESK